MEKYIETLLSHKLPRWTELPDFELYMDQVISLMQKYLSAYVLPEEALTPSMINNYVKMEVLPAPTKKKYNKEHLAKLIVICLLKKQMPLNAINFIMNKQISVSSLEVFYNYFIDLYDSAIETASKKASDDNSLLSIALSLTISSSASHVIAENAVSLLMPQKTENSKKEKK